MATSANDLAGQSIADVALRTSRRHEWDDAS